MTSLQHYTDEAKLDAYACSSVSDQALEAIGLRVACHRNVIGKFTLS